MGKKTKTGKHRLDKFYHLAKEQGYRSRAAFKLIQLNKKHDFLRGAKVLLDLCAAPGGWMQVARKFMPASSLVIGVDLDPIKPIPQCISLQEDITTAKCRSALREALQHWQADVVLHDGAPNVGGAWSKDAYGQSELTLHAAKLACEFLRKGGTFVTKVFRSQDYNALLWVLKQLFSVVQVTKPEASRSTSAEIYFVCKGYFAPKEIDPKLFTPAHVFKDVGKEKKELTLNNVIKDAEKTRRKAEGYDDAMPLTMHKTLNVLEFLGAELPVNALAEHSAIVFDDDSEPFLHHSATTEEVKELCNDIKVLGIRELKILLKWHKALKAYKRELEQGVAPRGDRLEIDNKPSLEDISDSEKLEKQIEELRRREESRMKRLKRKKKQLRIKSANISAMGGIEQDADFDSNLFSFAMIHTLKDLDQVQEANSSATIVPHDEDSESGSQDADEESISNDERYDMLEEELQGMYESYKERRQIVDRKRRQKAKELGLPVSDEENSVELNDEPEAEAEGEEAVVMPQLTSALQVDFEDPLEVAKQKWFERDLLRDLEQSGDLKAPDPAPTVSTSLDSDDEEQELPASSATIGKRRKRKKDDGEEKEAFNFEEVPAEDFGTWSDDSDAVAEGLALGTAMLRKKRREQIINDAYNRYAFHDNPADLPDWFVEDEEAHCRPQLPVTKAEVDEQKLRLQELNAKPIKKILEAKGRKKMRAMKKWEILKNQAKSITDNPDMAMKEKMKKIEKLYARNKKKKVDKTYVVSQKRGGVHASSGAKKRGSFLVRVDPRMKKDKRGMKAAERRKKRVKH